MIFGDTSLRLASGFYGSIKILTNYSHGTTLLRHRVVKMYVNPLSSIYGVLFVNKHTIFC